MSPRKPGELPEGGHPVMELDRSASTLLDVLVEAGHLDERSLEKVNDLLLDVQTTDGIIGAAQLRQIVAEVMITAVSPSATAKSCATWMAASNSSVSLVLPATSLL